MATLKPYYFDPNKLQIPKVIVVKMVKRIKKLVAVAGTLDHVLTFVDWNS